MSLICRPVFVSELVSMRIRIQRFKVNKDLDADPDSDLGFWWKKIGKKLQLKKIINFLLKNSIYLCLGLRKGLQGTIEALSPQKRTSSTSKLEISFFVAHLSPPGSGSGSSRPKSMRIRIRNTVSDHGIKSHGPTSFLLAQRKTHFLALSQIKTVDLPHFPAKNIDNLTFDTIFLKF